MKTQTIRLNKEVVTVVSLEDFKVAGKLSAYSVVIQGYIYILMEEDTEDKGVTIFSVYTGRDLRIPPLTYYLKQEYFLESDEFCGDWICGTKLIPFLPEHRDRFYDPDKLRCLLLALEHDLSY